MSHFFAYLSRMKYITRWGLMRNTVTENIQEHSLQVAMTAHALAVIRNRFFGGNINPEKVVTLAVFHDVSETITGDLAAPIKYFNPEINDQYKKIEKVANKKLLSMLPDELKPEYKNLLTHYDESAEWKIVKAADKISAYLKCVEELKAGNREFSKAKRAIEKEIRKLQFPEVNYFMKTFAPSFNLSLDELN